VVNALSHERWYSGLTGAIIMAAICSFWSLSNKQFYDEQQKKKDQQNQLDKAE
jgi:hypothetical protein